MILKKFKIRASQIGKIMSEPLTVKDREAGKLSKTTESYVKDWLTQQIYGYEKELDTKEIKKGHAIEEEAIITYGLYKGSFFYKNEDHFSNDYITGTPDIIDTAQVIDTKCSWDCYTFPAFDTELPKKDYYWQMQGYMELTGKKQATIVYCLMNTPNELRYTELDHADYTELDMKLRFKEFVVDYNSEDVAKIYERVEQIRGYIAGLKI